MSTTNSEPLLAALPRPNDADAPDQFLRRLRSIIGEILPQDTGTRINASENATWVLILNQLHDAFLVTFSFNDVWNAQPERVKLVEACLETIESILKRVDGALIARKEVPGSTDIPRKLFCALFTLCHTLDLYADTDIVPRDGVSMPGTLRASACRTATLMLRCMGGSHSPTGDEPMWKIMRSIIEELLSLSQAIINPNLPLTFPFATSLFYKPRIQTLNPEDSQTRVMMIFSSPADVPRFLSLIVDITMNAVHPPTLCSWFLFDLEQKAHENAQQAFEYCLSVSTAARFKALSSILSALPFHLLKKADRISPLMNLPFRLLRQRLLSGTSKTGWDAVDHFFLEAHSLPNLRKTELVEILSFIGEENADGSVQ
ncbi:hypothetical protein F5878DRAFT_330731 [Lentinula raphanica]|uniref:Uncharacterized protein n=1 Tax=Lentinula raphanica TaxID=153919 RepID=A0AA38P2C6_9AGAR|nr:hypothetical protein F5878DRAFT_330731 [Lentinula raphanica]